MEYDIYDPSNTVAGGYWQLGRARLSPEKSRWQAVAAAINQGLPAREVPLFSRNEPVQEPELWGCVRWAGLFWTYRVFLTGRDNFDRPGRYFFVLFRVDSPADLRNILITRIVRDLEQQTAIPLDIARLEHPPTTLGKPSNPNGQIANEFLVQRALSLPEGGHHGWIVRGGRIEREYSDLPSPLIRPNPYPIPPSPCSLPEVSTPPTEPVSSLVPKAKPDPKETRATLNPMIDDLRDLRLGITELRTKLHRRALWQYVLSGIVLLAIAAGFNRLGYLERELNEAKSKINELKSAQETKGRQMRQELDELKRHVEDYTRDLETKKKKKPSTVPANEPPDYQPTRP